MIQVPKTIVAALCAQYHISPQALSYLGGGEESSDGIVYEYDQDGLERVLKIMAFPHQDTKSLQRIQSRLAFTRFMSEHGVDLVYPLPREDGTLVASALSGEQVFIAFIMPKAEGIHAKNEMWDAAFAQRLGKLIGSMHRITKLYPPSQQVALNGSGEDDILGWKQEWQYFYDECSDSEIKARWVTIRERLDKLPIHSDAYGYIHNDPHFQNILVNGDRLVLLDFDVANYNWFMTDIAIVLQSLLFLKTGGMNRPVKDAAQLRQFFTEFMHGYRSENDLADYWLEQIDLFISYRRILLFVVSQDWLAEHSQVREKWKEMILNEPPVLA
jgi:Ser/Thr protein kinase RdoA (MazF antagonist)